MKKLILVGASLLALSACTPMEQGASVGAATGAVVGGVTTGSVVGAGVGAAVGAGVGAITGAVAGELLGRNANNPDMCYYRDRRGELYQDACPQG